MGKKKDRKKLLLTVIIWFFISLTACGYAENQEVTTENIRIYRCDYKSVSINTEIITTINDEEISIVGNIFKFLTDPLTAKDKDGNVLGYAGNAYKIISQDNHGIYVGNSFEVNMCGNIKLSGESYKLKDADGNIVGVAEFNMLNTYGSIKDVNGSLIAEYLSELFMNDYTVKIYDNNVCSDMSILLIVASYVSDNKADAR